MRGIIRIDETVVPGSWGVLASDRRFAAIAGGRDRKEVVAIARVFAPVHGVRISDRGFECCAAVELAFRLDAAG